MALVVEGFMDSVLTTKDAEPLWKRIAEQEQRIRELESEVSRLKAILREPGHGIRAGKPT